MPTLTLDQKDELVASTFDRMSPEIINHTILGIPIYRRLLESPYRQTVTGGYRVRFPIVIDNNESFGWFGWGHTFDPQPREIMAWSYATLKQGAGDYTIEWLEKQINSGPEAFVSLVNAKKQDLIQSVRQTLNNNAWGDGTGAGATEPTGLQGNITATPTSGTYLGFDRSTEFWARPWYFNGASIAASTHGPHDLNAPQDNSPVALGAVGDISDKYALIEDYLQVAWDSILMDGESAADVFHAVDTKLYHDYLKIPRYCPGYELGVHDGTFNLGYTGVTFMGAPIIHDTEINGAPSYEWRIVNTKYMPMIVDGSAFFEWVAPRSPYDALVTAQFLLVRFQVVDTFPRKHALLNGLSTWQA